jgi:hypothetical protein
MGEMRNVEVTWRESEGGVAALADLCHALLTKVPYVYELHLNAVPRNRRNQCMIGVMANPARTDADELADSIICILERFGVEGQHITVHQIRVWRPMRGAPGAQEPAADEDCPECHGIGVSDGSWPQGGKDCGHCAGSGKRTGGSNGKEA